jgi:hypothetical protein
MFAILPAVYARGGQISEFLGRIPGKKEKPTQGRLFLFWCGRRI